MRATHCACRHPAVVIPAAAGVGSPRGPRPGSSRTGASATRAHWRRRADAAGGRRECAKRTGPTGPMCSARRKRQAMGEMRSLLCLAPRSPRLAPRGLRATTLAEVEAEARSGHSRLRSTSTCSHLRRERGKKFYKGRNKSNRRRVNSQKSFRKTLLHSPYPSPPRQLASPNQCSSRTGRSSPLSCARSP